MPRWYLKFASYKTPNDIFNAVKTGDKTIETRPGNAKGKKNYADIKPEDILIMRSNDTGEELAKVVTFVHSYKSISEMAENEPVGKIIPGINTTEELVNVFDKLKKKWGRRYTEKLEKFGIVAIGFK
jgi:ASC-1-like (ASCH) protein